MNKLLLSLGLLFGFSGCLKGGNSSPMLKINNDSKTQIVDVLKGQPSPKVLKMKYSGLSANCTLSLNKAAPQDARPTDAVLTSTSPTPEPPADLTPIVNPAENQLIYDLVAQAKIDPELKKDNEAVLTLTAATPDEPAVVAKIKFSPVIFADLLNLEVGQAKYIMKHTPVLAYSFSYKVLQSDTSIEGSGDGLINERIRGEKVMAAYATRGSGYKLILGCSIETIVNPADATNEKEFASQWSCVGCATTDPVNP